MRDVIPHGAWSAWGRPLDCHTCTGHREVLIASLGHVDSCQRDSQRAAKATNSTASVAVDGVPHGGVSKCLGARQAKPRGRVSQRGASRVVSLVVGSRRPACRGDLSKSGVSPGDLVATPRDTCHNEVAQRLRSRGAGLFLGDALSNSSRILVFLGDLFSEVFRAE